MTKAQKKYNVGDLVVATDINGIHPKGTLGSIVHQSGDFARIDFDGTGGGVFYPQECFEEFDGTNATDFFVGDLTDPPEESDMVDRPPHYNSGGIECIEYLKDNMSWEGYTGYLEGNCKKYMHRWRHKGKPLEDLFKSRWYLNRLIEELEGPEGK